MYDRSNPSVTDRFPCCGIPAVTLVLSACRVHPATDDTDLAAVRGQLAG